LLFRDAELQIVETPMIRLTVNGQPVEVEAEPDTPLLWILRDHLNLTGTKYGCGVAACGACTVHFNGVALRSCVMPLSACEGQRIVTIEGLAQGAVAHPVQQAWIDHQVPQCGYCQSGMIMAASALLAQNPNPSSEEIASAITNICRCGTYPRVRKAVRSLASTKGRQPKGGAR
jgi:isoquinoline 1-oxidoreductase alpha subunit